MPINPDDASMLTGFFEAVDAARLENERKWGFGRLEILCGLSDPPLLAKWRGQQARWRTALEDAWMGEVLTRDELALVEQKAGAMLRGWAALDACAEAAGHRPVAPWVWEIPLQDGTIAAFVQTDAEASKVIAEGRHVAVYTAAEVGRIIDLIPEALQLAKVHFPGAKIALANPHYRSREPAPDDPIPFGEEPPQ